jgi:hypothetical protein
MTAPRSPNTAVRGFGAASLPSAAFAGIRHVPYARMRNRRSVFLRSAARAEALLPSPLRVHSLARGFDALERPWSPATKSTSFAGGIASRCVARLPPASVASTLTMTALRFGSD